MQPNIVIVGLVCLLTAACHGSSSTRTMTDGSAGHSGARDAGREAPAADAVSGIRDAAAEAATGDGAAGVATGEPCQDGTGASDCCPVGTAGGGTCGGNASTCYSRCSFPDDAATQGTRSGFSCVQGIWLAGHGLFPCTRP